MRPTTKWTQATMEKKLDMELDEDDDFQLVVSIQAEEVLERVGTMKIGLQKRPMKNSFEQKTFRSAHANQGPNHASNSLTRCLVYDREHK